MDHSLDCLSNPKRIQKCPWFLKNLDFFFLLIVDTLLDEIHEKNKRCSFFLALWLAIENVKENSHVENLTLILIGTLFMLLTFSTCPHSKFPKHKADTTSYLKLPNGSPCFFRPCWLDSSSYIISVTVDFSISLLQYWHLGWDNSLLWGAVRCLRGCLLHPWPLSTPCQ